MNQRNSPGCAGFGCESSSHGAQKRDNRVQEAGHTLEFFEEQLLGR